MPLLSRPRAAACLSALAWCALAGTVQAVPLTVSVTGADGKPLAQAVVYVMVRGAKALAEPGATAQIGQRERQFTPQVNVIQTGTAVSFPNFDTVRHHVYSFSPTRTFELKLYAGTPAAPVVFDKPGTAVLGCNIHDRMSAWVHVVDTPLFAKTDASGKATLEVPAGDHKLRTWHHLMPEPALPVEQALSVAAAGAQVSVKLAVQATEP
jgi:plastocyanin